MALNKQVLVAPVHLLELLIVVIVCGFLIGRAFAVWRGPYRANKQERRLFGPQRLPTEGFPLHSHKCRVLLSQRCHWE